MIRGSPCTTRKQNLHPVTCQSSASGPSVGSAKEIRYPRLNPRTFFLEGNKPVSIDPNREDLAKAYF
jgi:hypothetical protein